MRTGLDIVVMGDIHGEFGKLNAWLNRRRPAIVLQCGDFGYWPNNVSKRERKRGKPLVPKLQDTKVYWCDGNHEDFWAIRDRERDELFPNAFYMRRGTTLKLPDGRVVLFIGGAESHDKEWRVEQEAAGGEKIWFAEERISEEVLAALPPTHIDVIVTHAAPREFEIWGGGYDMIRRDTSRLVLSAVLHRYKEQKPLWFFGHYHARITGSYSGVQYRGLDMIGCTDWWVPLPPPQRGEET